MSFEYSKYENYNNLLSELENYILNNENIHKSIQIKMQPQNISKKEKSTINKEKTKLDNIFIPKEQESLFWCLYIMKNGYNNYEMINYRNLIFEKKVKIEYIERIRKEKQLIKSYKFASVINVENNLLNEQKLSINSFLTLCIIENLNVLFIKNKCYFELIMNDTDDLHIIYLLDKDKGNYGYELSTITKSDIKKSQLYKLDNIDKPVKSISSYKVQELVDICNKLGIEITNNDTNKSKSKKDLYESIIQYF
uniref:Uncharacterized protein n=1 Tax=viral metagenome TaxID=1070528 RepID=A0A6C0EPY4_9ZZZZ